MPGGGAAKWLSGSATPQKTRPMPIPAAKSIANQAIREYWGFSSSLPRTTRPIGETAIHTEKATKPLTMRM